MPSIGSRGNTFNEHVGLRNAALQQDSHSSFSNCSSSNVPVTPECLFFSPLNSDLLLFIYYYLKCQRPLSSLPLFSQLVVAWFRRRRRRSLPVICSFSHAGRVRNPGREGGQRRAGRARVYFPEMTFPRLSCRAFINRRPSFCRVSKVRRGPLG